MQRVTRRTGKLLAVASAAMSLVMYSFAAQADTVIKLAFGSEYVMVTPQLTKKFWGDIASEFEKEHPGVKVQLMPIAGGFDDIVTKVSMSYGNSANAPDVAQLPAQQLAQWAVSGYLLPLDKYAAKELWWKDYPDAVKQESTYQGAVYGISQGVNTNGLIYDRDVFKKAGLPEQWQPKNWAEVLDAARKIKKSAPGVWPIWAIAGPAGGTSALVLGAANLLSASSDPTVKDSSGKWAVDTKGIREVLNFYKQASAEGLLAPSSLLLNSNSPALATPEMPKHHIGIALAGNYVPAAWSKEMSSPYWPDAARDIGFAKIPTFNGGGAGYASAFAGWGVSISKSSRNPDLAWQLINLIVRKDNMIKGANWTGLVPPAKSAWTDKAYTELAPPFQEEFAKVLDSAKSVPSDAEFPVWAHAFQAATETVILKPNTNLDDVVKSMKAEVSNQLGADKVLAR
jgi:multiple sugar transport system substrate-binding protein